MITKQDYLIGALVGFLTGLFFLVVLSYLEVSFPYQFAAPIVVAVAFAFGVWLGGFLGRYIGFFNQFGKFAAVGFLSASIDFSILNYVSYLTGISAGLTVGWINVPGFVIAVINGYLWNKLWVFRDRPAGEKLFTDFPKFILVTATGLLINSGIIVLLTTFVPIPSGFSPQIWLNVAKISANAVALIWNFLGYKFVVFRR